MKKRSRYCKFDLPGFDFWGVKLTDSDQMTGKNVTSRDPANPGYGCTPISAQSEEIDL
jgi:hypothetical protein